MNALDARDCAEPDKVEQRKQSQRERILDAAMSCFIRYGFHNASMATIAHTANMSPGLIYRYFDSKNAIIFAIIEFQLAIARQRMCDIRNADDLCAALVDYFRMPHDSDAETISPPLFLELSAYATRDPDVARAVRQMDDTVRDKLADWFARGTVDGGFGFPADVARERALALTLLMDGLKARKAREPDLDLARLRKAVESIVNAIVAG